MERSIRAVAVGDGSDGACTVVGHSGCHAALGGYICVPGDRRGGRCDGPGHCSSLLSRVVPRSPEAAVRLWCNADPTAPAGSGWSAGVALLAFGASRGGPARCWADGSTVAVQFTLSGQQSVTVTCQYSAPTGGGDTPDHKRFSDSTTISKDELDCQVNTRQLWMSDYQFVTHSRYRTSCAFSEDCVSWSASMRLDDALAVFHPQAPGFSEVLY